MDVSSRRLRYFVTLAEELHFSRAAARLFLTQQALSKQIRELEDEVGVRLVERTTRTVALTEAGTVFVASARRALDVIEAGVEAARRAHDGDIGTLRLGFCIGAALELTTPILAEFGRRHPRVRVELREAGFDDPSAGLADDRADVALIRLPVGAPGIESEPLFTEPLVAAVPAGHPFAARESVTAAELAAEPLVVGRSPDPVWTGFWTLDAHRDPSLPHRVLHSSSQSEELEMVAAGLAVAVTVAGLRRYAAGRGGLHYVPVAGIPGSTLAVAWRRGRRTPAVAHFAEVAREVREAETAVVRVIEGG
ncbi:LysR family transcriptional regulator [Phytomonospora endophytica]|uniref:DNA-binding transcriptional LysR family regulator n=1 Tax=Phytomonospora endophytica TaxID=714109 RepID=A0A841FLT4_9ACTN|nr:LysR substrate-binding domain-containing protein [Phytomonospora endophytica]MBB6036945.1 DNA-binding transcriptional LysR family regulator [Phytomonospora endophytica]